MIESPVPGSTAVVGSAVAPLHPEARVSSEQISQRVSGQLVSVIAVEREWVHVRGDDDYEGWINRGYLAGPAPEAGWNRSCSLGCRTRRGDGSGRLLPVGAYLLPDETLAEGQAVEADALRHRFPAAREAVVRSATGLFSGTSYEWGGISSWGADCSGFVQTIFRLHGSTLPRDARLQAERGARIERIEDCEGGDLLFFSDREDGRITHVGISLGRGAMAHLALGRGGHAVDDLLSPGDAYAADLARRFRFARSFPLG